MKTIILAVCLVLAQGYPGGDRKENLKLRRDQCSEYLTDEGRVHKSKKDLKAKNEVFDSHDGLTDEQKEKLKKHRSECLSETKADETLVNKLKSGDFKTENEALKKYAHCMLVKSELMTKDGKFKKEVALAKVPNAADKPQVEKLIDACLANKGNTPQQTAWNYVKCYHEKDPKHAIFL